MEATRADRDAQSRLRPIDAAGLHDDLLDHEAERVQAPQPGIHEIALAGADELGGVHLGPETLVAVTQAEGRRHLVVRLLQ